MLIPAILVGGPCTDQDIDVEDDVIEIRKIVRLPAHTYRGGRVQIIARYLKPLKVRGKSTLFHGRVVFEYYSTY